MSLNVFDLFDHHHFDDDQIDCHCHCSTLAMLIMKKSCMVDNPSLQVRC